MSPGSPGIPSQTWASATDPGICRQRKKQIKKERESRQRHRHRQKKGEVVGKQQFTDRRSKEGEKFIDNRSRGHMEVRHICKENKESRIQ